MSLYLYKRGSPNYTVTIGLYNVDPVTHLPVGITPLVSTTFAASSLTTTATWCDYSFSSGYQVVAGTEYALVLSGDGGGTGTTNFVVVRVNTVGGYTRGAEGYSGGSGKAWTSLPAQDIAFKEGQF